jgi:hypothetical protein
MMSSIVIVKLDNILYFSNSSLYVCDYLDFLCTGLFLQATEL